MLLTIACAVIAIAFWPVTLLVLAVMYWPLSIGLLVVAFFSWVIVSMFKAVFN